MFVPIEFRPPLSAQPGVVDIGLILILATVGAVILLILKLFVPLRVLSHIVVMFSGFYLGSFWGDVYGILVGTFCVAMRLWNNIWANNLATALSAIAFGLLIGYFVTPQFSMLLIASLAVYDAIGVLYSKHIQQIWLAKVKNQDTRISKEKILDGILMAIPTHRGYEITGVGDYALPLVLVISTAKLNLLAGLICALGASMGYYQLNKIRGRILPGMPFIGVGCALGLLVVNLFSLI